MSLTVKSLNGDTAFLLSFSPPVASIAPFTILIDPWLVGPATILSSVFSISEQTTKPCISSLQELVQEPDIILISQDKPDHCHEETLRQLPKDCRSTILAIPSAARKIRSWKHFRPELVRALPKFVEDESQSIYRQEIPPVSSRASCGEVTLSWMPARRDVSGLHHAIGITYRPPGGVELPPSPPASPRSYQTGSSSSRTIASSPSNGREQTLSVIYSPHGVSYDIIRPYATSHLMMEAALPLTALIHSFDRVENPWYMGGNISAGLPGGLVIAKSLYAQAWISAHDADKNNRGLSVKQTRIGKYAMHEIKKKLFENEGGRRKSIEPTALVALTSGEEHRIGRG
ncbi:hypothetical protein P280DRAFT_305693 [Massarina eburnea CBS 473.64]|uniref:Metallo-beta-lactamase domain-containing protein n=1 Tax=Massarina eburnea CBS 473.64 TaxID=1395130 RepID=A0A6A6S2B4_9PLEO|nr:hypothetical protein P280DRAFT_305693 [Massarina eburnea CBS 473.64]